MTGNLHPNSDIDHIYGRRPDGGRGIKQIRTLYESRIIAVRQHLIQYIVNSEGQGIIKVGKELLDLQHIDNYINKQPRFISKTFKKSKNLQHEKNHKFLIKSIYFWLAFESYCFHGHA